MAEAISSSSSVAPGVPLTVQVAVQSQQLPDRTAPDGSAAQATGPALAAPAQAGTAAPTNLSTQAGAATNDADNPSAKSTGAVEPKVLDQAVKSLEDYIKPQQTITLQVDKSSGQTYVKIVDAQTKLTILQIPSAQVLAMARKLREMANPQAASGVLVDQEG